jgi:hypothetical protein
MSTTNRVAAFLQCFKWGVSTTHVWQLQHASPQKERKVKYLILAVGCYGYIIIYIYIHTYNIYIYIHIIYIHVCVSIFWGVTKGDSLGLVGRWVSRSSRIQPLGSRSTNGKWKVPGAQNGGGSGPGAQKRWVATEKSEDATDKFGCRKILGVRVSVGEQKWWNVSSICPPTQNPVEPQSTSYPSMMC